MQSNRIDYLLEQYFQKNISADEQAELNHYLSEFKTDGQLEEWMKTKWEQYQADQSLSADLADQYFREIELATLESPEAIQPEISQPASSPEASVHFLRNNWAKIAALLLVAATGYTVYLSTRENNNPVPKTQLSQAPKKEDVAPGGNYATLTLGDGSTMVLDSVSNGLIASQGNTQIIKLKNGELTYKNQQAGDKVVYNTMTTPIGGQYQLTLPDGTGIWLNAASSITYPTAFTGNERTVSITGEVYFEVAKNKNKPFRVNVGDQQIEVLGTHFNVNAYSDERSINTTLVEGSVKISAKSARVENQQELLLQPGQQSQLREGSLRLNRHPDIEETLAWKDGLFHFNGTSIETIMRNVSRWYGVEVVYEDKIEEQFVAEIPRNVNVWQLLELLELTRQVKFSVENKRITVSKG